MGTDPAALGTDPAALGTDPAALGTDPAALGTGPAALGTDPAALGTDPAALGTDPAALGTGPAALGTGPAALGTGPAALGTSPAALGTGPGGGAQTRTGTRFAEAVWTDFGMAFAPSPTRSDSEVCKATGRSASSATTTATRERGTRHRVTMRRRERNLSEQVFNARYKKIAVPGDVLSELVASQGLEPQQAESESAVLPLHHEASSSLFKIGGVDGARTRNPRIDSPVR